MSADADGGAVLQSPCAGVVVTEPAGAPSSKDADVDALIAGRQSRRHAYTVVGPVQKASREEQKYTKKEALEERLRLCRALPPHPSPGGTIPLSHLSQHVVQSVARCWQQQTRM